MGCHFLLQETCACACNRRRFRQYVQFCWQFFTLILKFSNNIMFSWVFLKASHTPKLISSTHPRNSADSDCVTGGCLTPRKLSIGWSKWEFTGAHRNSLLLQDSISRTWRGVTTCRREQRYFPRLANVSMNEQVAKDALLVNQKQKSFLFLHPTSVAFTGTTYIHDQGLTYLQSANVFERHTLHICGRTMAQAVQP